MREWGRFECIQAIEIGVDVPRVQAEFIRYWCGRVEGSLRVKLFRNMIER